MRSYATIAACSSPSRVWNTDHWTGNMYTDGVVQGGWETTVDQPGTPGILIALPGGEVGAATGPALRA